MRTSRASFWFGVLAAVLVAGCTLEQVMVGQSYVIETPPQGGCPRLAWRFVVDAQRVMSAAVTTGSQRPVASLSGPFGGDDSFRLTPAESAGGGAVTGRFTAQVTTLAIQGDVAGPACAGKTFRLHLGSYFASQTGGTFTGGNR